MTLRLELIAALKRQLKAQGITYARLAQAVGLSEAAVKRMFSRQALSLVRLEQICAVLGIGLAELAIESRQGHVSLAELDADSEEALVRDPALLLALYLVLNRWSEAEVLARYRFSPTEWTMQLARLDRMGVLELQPNNRVRLRTARNFRWRRGGPMQRFFQQKLLPEYFGKEFAGDDERLLLLSGMVSAGSAAHMQLRLAELAEEFDLLMAQDAALPANRRQGVSLVLAQRSWSLQLFAGLRRTSDG
jgi:transcriptional regulator with XRE-family HTH domain